MSLKEKVSAFTVFSNKKFSSLSNITSGISETSGKVKSASAGNLDISKQLKTANVKSKKQKSKSNGTKRNLRPSYLPDTALNSPVTGLSNGNVQLKSMRLHGSLCNIKYNLPGNAKADLDKEKSPILQTKKNKRHINYATNNRRNSSPSSSQRTLSVTSQVDKNNTSYNNVEHNQALPGKKSNRRMESMSEPFIHNISSCSDDAPVSPKRRKIHNLNQSFDSTQKAEIVQNNKDSSINNDVKTINQLPALGNGPYMNDSSLEAKRLFQHIIHPINPDEFFRNVWEQKPLLIRRHMPNYNKGWFSTKELDKILREQRVMFTENIDVVSYSDGKRETHNPVGQAFASVVWDYYQNGCSVRLLNPQIFSERVWKLLSILQEHFGSFVGANIYLTPPNTQGFAPHYDDIEVFMIQLEGKKRWRLYGSRCEAEALPKYPSKNFDQDEIGEPILDTVLNAGDLLYFPKGCIHQGNSLEDEHSMHITVSCMQKNSWGDFLEKLLPRALELAFEEDIEFRRALPPNYLNYMGVAYSDSELPERNTFTHNVERLMKKMIKYIPVDAAVDQMGKRFITDSLPPHITKEEKSSSCFEAGERWDKTDKCVRGTTELKIDNNIKLLRKGCLRLITEEDKCFIYHNLCNGRKWHEYEPQSIEIEPEIAAGVEFLLNVYPDYVNIEDLPLACLEDKISLASLLYERGLLLTQEPLDHVSDTDSSG